MSRRRSPGAPAAAARRAAPVPAVTIDALGKKCPVPIIMLAQQISEVEIGEVITVQADDPAAKTDVPAWCALKSHEFLRMADLGAGWSFAVRRCY